MSLATDHSMHFSNDDFAVSLTMQAANDDFSPLWGRVVLAVMDELRVPGGPQIVFTDVDEPVPSRWRRLRFRPERHGEVTVSTDSDAQMLSSMFGGISVRKGDKLTWGLGIEGDC
jgi:hypothetical protein